MCRIVGYLGLPILLDYLLYKPEHSLIVQSYSPREMTSGVVNADGFGIGWYHPQRDTNPFTYKNTLPIWSDVNLPHLSRYVESGCVLGYVRSATTGQSVDLSNCQPFQSGKLLGVHNGFIQHFRKSLFRPIRDRLSDALYQSIDGTTDSEHIFALVVNELTSNELETTDNLVTALHNVLKILAELAAVHKVLVSANLIFSDGQQLVASRFATGLPAPSLYYLKEDPMFPESAIVASEPLFVGDWIRCDPQSILHIQKQPGKTLTISTTTL